MGDDKIFYKGLDNTVILCIIKIWQRKMKNRNAQVVVLGRFTIAEY